MQLFSVINPSSGKVIGSVPDMNETDAEEAVKAAYKAFQTWKETSPKVSQRHSVRHISLNHLSVLETDFSQ